MASPHAGNIALASVTPAPASPAVVERRSSYQPFQCLVCSSRFTRHENLKRHAALHTRSPSEASLPCELCSATFSRPDLRHRHMKRKHMGHLEKRSKGKRQRDLQAPTPPSQGGDGRSQGDKASSASPAQSHQDDLEMDSGIWLDQNDQNPEAINLAVAASVASAEGDHTQTVTAPLTLPTSISDSSCIASIVQGSADLQLLGADFLEHASNVQMDASAIPHSAPFGTNILGFSFDQGSPERLLYGSIDITQAQEDWSPSTSQIAHGCQLFFTHVSHFVPFLHQPTFDAAHISNHLLLSMLCIAYQYGEDPDCVGQPGSGVSLSERCFHRARTVVLADEDKTDDPAHNVSMVQAYLLLQIYAMMYLCGNNSAYALKTHSKMISLARASGLSQPIPTEPTTTKDLDSLWREFIRAESHKRTLFAAHQIDTLWYQLLSIPRQFSHLEIKHELPCPEDHWTASSSVDWAHRKLVAGNSGTSVQYPDAVRRFLSGADLSSLPAFDPYGAINITHFLVSSAQEISGWCTMTGMLSTERLEPLRSSLLALGPFIRSKPDSTDVAHAALCEATWESAMIEVQIWSPSHTGGIVGGSMDAVLHQLSYLAPSCEFLCESNTAKTIQPHVDWFLRYLDATIEPDAEAPWITLYAYKAFMIAWQLVRGSMLGSMQVVGVDDGDAEGALAWARKVFGRRQRWQLGKIIMGCLDSLQK
ncbi:hypothetical protein CEP52_007747 [Fusarium oligoseptatum]|uniref:C2H2-type domain-containing protein n=2 Tax=Fusarium solani species complex TaxID=232080 RepID=A0A428TLK6_9HYPO|nr:hypothetical protein CEP52_007747 [Fusarium oligoseptatum]RSM13226.1 hypothetical protein CDV31_005930 [Fusarium ambrosium]